MRPISGLERPWVQRLLLALSVALTAIAVWGAIGTRRASREIERLRAAELDARVQRVQLEARAAREQSAREALALELGRQRAGGAAAPREIPTLTLTPLRTRGSTPPKATVKALAPTELIELRLVLPTQPARISTYRIGIRNWSGGEVVWTRGELKASSREGRQMVTAHVTGDVLQDGVYEIVLTGARSDGESADVAAYEVGIGSAS